MNKVVKIIKSKVSNAMKLWNNLYILSYWYVYIVNGSFSYCNHIKLNCPLKMENRRGHSSLHINPYRVILIYLANAGMNKDLWHCGIWKHDLCQSFFLKRRIKVTFCQNFDKPPYLTDVS